MLTKKIRIIPDGKDNIYDTHKCRLLRVYNLTEMDKLFLFRFEDPEIAQKWNFKPGQFVEVSMPGFGEVPISICSSAMRIGFFELCIRKAGRVTTKIHELLPGTLVGIRGPYGNGFPMEKFWDKDLLLVAAGLGMAPLRSVFLYALDNRWRFGNITIINSAKYCKELLFDKELEALRDIAEAENIKIIQTVTRDSQCTGLKGRAHEHLDKVNVNPENCGVALCGPPRMYKSMFEELVKLNFDPRNIFVTLERRMKCGVGKCGHCNLGNSTSWKYACKDGPVFDYYDIISTPGMLE
ncbi:MAG TPA: FAD-binding oxidoreductase [candidate division Zixibacteria bacterium]|nr:FAD-binding oxidoreductase [candidate division Zixibacteria bacterium]